MTITVAGCKPVTVHRIIPHPRGLRDNMDPWPLGFGSGATASPQLSRWQRAVNPMPSPIRPPMML